MFRPALMQHKHAYSASLPTAAHGAEFAMHGQRAMHVVSNTAVAQWSSRVIAMMHQSPLLQFEQRSESVVNLLLQRTQCLPICSRTRAFAFLPCALAGLELTWGLTLLRSWASRRLLSQLKLASNSN